MAIVHGAIGKVFDVPVHPQTKDFFPSPYSVAPFGQLAYRDNHVRHCSAFLISPPIVLSFIEETLPGRGVAPSSSLVGRSLARRPYRPQTPKLTQHSIRPLAAWRR